MQLVVDSHTHTLASPDGFSTVDEMAAAADHAPELINWTPMLHFMGYGKLPRELSGVRMFYGVELNIMDFDGRVDMPEDILARQHVVIASFHTMCTKAGTCEENTHAYLRAMENPYVNIIGHPDDGFIPIDFERFAGGQREPRAHRGQQFLGAHRSVPPEHGGEHPRDSPPLHAVRDPRGGGHRCAPHEWRGAVWRGAGRS